MQLHAGRETDLADKHSVKNENEVTIDGERRSSANLMGSADDRI
jgi:hypothetical protein